MPNGLERYKISKLFKRRNWRQTVHVVGDVARTAFDLYIGIKKKEPLYVATALAGAVKTATSWEMMPEYAPDILANMGFKWIYGNPSITHFVIDVLKEIQARSEISSFSPREGMLIREYHIGESIIYSVYNNNSDSVESIWCEDKDKFEKEFSKEINLFFGNYISAHHIRREYHNSITLKKYEPFLNTYVSPIDIEDFCNIVLKFRNKGIGHSFLLLGAPGTGKTTFASLASEKLNMQLMVVDCACLSSMISEEADFTLERLVQMLRPQILLLDDLDRVDEIDFLLGELERINSLTDNIMVMASVNSMAELPEALKRPGRFDEVVRFSLPEYDARYKILQNHLNHLGVRLSNDYCIEITRMSEGCSGADLREIARQVFARGFDKIDLESLIKSIMDRKELE